MIAIRPLSTFDPARFVVLAGGYNTSSVYRVERRESDAATTWQLTLETLPAPRAYRFPYDAEELLRYTELARGPFGLGAFDGERWIGVALGEAHAWNRSLWVWEFHIDPEYQRQGAGRRLMDEMAERGRAAGLRAVVLETQNTNVPAIRFYRRVGFSLDGINVAYYTNHDLEPERTVALFMTRRLE